MDAVTQKRVAYAYSSSITTRIDLTKAWSCPWEELAPYPITPSNVVADDRWVIPEEWCPINRRKPSARTIDFTKVVPKGFAAGEAEGLKRRLKRLAILDRFQTIRIGHKTVSPPAPISWVQKCLLLTAAAQHSLETFAPVARSSLCPDGPTLFASVPEAEFEAIKSAHPSWGHLNIRRLNALFSEGYFDDWPSNDVANHKFQKRAGSKASDPFDDVAFTHILRAALWLNRIQGNVLQAYLDTKDIHRASDGGTHHSRTLAYRRDSVQSWTSATLQPGTVFPFHVTLSAEKRRLKRYTAWPLDTVSGLKSLLFLCQTANAILILASTGMRIGELTALTHDSLMHRDGRPYLTGRSFKDTDARDGQERQWPFPQAAATGFEAQLELARALSNGDGFWVPFSEKNVTGVPTLDFALRSFGKTIGVVGGAYLADLDGTITPHRFRYSTARYVALSLTAASQILFDVLGHNDIEVTLGYALQDPELHEDINKIRREIKAVRVKEVFDHAEQNGGTAAEMVRKVKADMLARSGKDELDTDDIAEAAAILGESELVKPGVLCTAQPLERGACSPVPGVRDVGACTSSCMHHLELAANRHTRQRKLDYLLEQIDGRDLGVRVFYQGQIIANFDAFPSLIEDYEADPRLRAALSDCDPKTWAGLQVEVRHRLDRIMGVSR